MQRLQRRASRSAERSRPAMSGRGGSCEKRSRVRARLRAARVQRLSNGRRRCGRYDSLLANFAAARPGPSPCPICPNLPSSAPGP